VKGSDGSVTAGCGWERGGELAVIAVVGQNIEVYSLADAVMDGIIEDR
jgi:hypothetical protein